MGSAEGSRRQLVTHRGDGVANLVADLGHVLLEVEDDEEVGAAFRRGGTQLVDLRNALQRLLDAVDDLALHGLRRGARIRKDDRHHRVFHVGNLVDAQVLQRQQP